MKAMFKPAALTGLLFAASLSFNACSKSPVSQTELLVGDWTQSAPIDFEQDGMGVSMADGYMSYTADGKSSGGLKMVLKGVPADFSTFDIKSGGTWRIEEGILIENSGTTTVSSASNATQGVAMAAQMQSVMNMPVETRSEIKSLTKNELVIYQEETDLTMRFER